MKQHDQLFADIAHEHLGIATLKPRMSDSLDFHDVAVWQVKAALEAAFHAGAKAMCSSPAPTQDLPKRFDKFEIQPCRRFHEEHDPERCYFEVCEPQEADVWTLYGRIRGEGVQAIGDFNTREHAEEIYSSITGQRYGL